MFHGTADVLHDGIGRIIAVIEAVDAYQRQSYQTVQAGEGVESSATYGNYGQVIVFIPLHQQFHGRAVGNGEAALARLVEPGEGQLYTSDLRLLQQLQAGLEAVLIALQGIGHGLGLPVGTHQHHRGIDGHGLHPACFVHRSIVGHEQRRAFALQRSACLQVEQVGEGVCFQTAVVGTDELVVARTGDDEQPAHGVGGGLHLPEHQFQVLKALLVRARRLLHGTQSQLLGRALHTLIDEVIVGAVAQRIGIVDDGHQRQCACHLLVGVGLVDGVALFCAGHRQ